MSNKQKHIPTLAATLLLGLGAAGAAIGAGQADPGGEPFRCEIRASTDGGMIGLEGVVHADAATGGTYQFRVTGAGRSGGSNIVQGGSFQVDPDEPAILGRVMLGGNGGAFDASLAVSSDGTTVTCAERVGDAI